MAKIHFVTGKTLDVTLLQYDQIVGRMRDSNIRFWMNRDTGDVVPLTSPSMVLLERGEPFEKPEPAVEKTDVEKIREQIPENDEAKEEPKTKQEERDEMMAEMFAKSNCNKNGHEGQNQIIYYQETAQVRKGKRVVSKRYFPVCEFCGVRGRYIAANKLEDNLKEAAKEWIEG